MADAPRLRLTSPTDIGIEMDEIGCFSCKYMLANAAPAFDGHIWTVICPACGVVNKLTPTPDRTVHFKVSGAFFVFQKAPRE